MFSTTKSGEEGQYGELMRPVTPRQKCFSDNSKLWGRGGARNSGNLDSGGSRLGTDAPNCGRTSAVDGNNVTSPMNQGDSD